jgi:hypothetical protein
MSDTWMEQLPTEFTARVVAPVRFEYHVDSSAHAERIIGFDANNNKCYSLHAFMLIEEGFDIEEMPIRIETYYERVVAWSLQDGQWLRIKSYSDRLDRCSRKLTTLPPELAQT